MLSGVILRNAIFCLESKGHNFIDLLEEISITPDDLYNQDLILSPYQMGIFVRKTVERLQDNRIGLRIGYESPYSALGVLGQIYQNCNTYAEVLNNMIKHINLIDALNEYSYEIKPDGIYHIRRSNSSWNENYPEATRQATELFIGLCIRSRRELLGREIKPVKIYTPYAKEGKVDLLEEFFHCPVEFNAKYACFVLPLEMLDWKVPTANPAALKHYDSYIQQIKNNRNIWTEHTKQHISLQLRNSTPSLTLISSLMNMSARNLQRYLKSEGTTFQQLIDQVRHDSALHLLKQVHLSISEVSEMLGFDVQNSFNRFLHKKEGKTPLELRRELTETYDK